MCFDVDRAPFHDLRVRRALAQAVDREKLTDVHLDGMYFPAGGGIVPPGMAGHTPDINLPYAPRQARELLAEAGFAGGQNFPPVVARTHDDVPFAIVRQAVQEQWRRVLGLDVHLQPTDWGTPVDDAHLYITAWAAGERTGDPSYFLDTFARSHGLSGKHQAFHYLLARARRTVEPQARLELYRRADRLLVQEALMAPLAYARAHFLVKPWVRGYFHRGTGNLRWKDLVIEPH